MSLYLLLNFNDDFFDNTRSLSFIFENIATRTPGIFSLWDILRSVGVLLMSLKCITSFIRQPTLSVKFSSTVTGNFRSKIFSFKSLVLESDDREFSTQLDSSANRSFSSLMSDSSSRRMSLTFSLMTFLSLSDSELIGLSITFVTFSVIFFSKLASRLSFLSSDVKCCCCFH